MFKIMKRRTNIAAHLFEIVKLNSIFDSTVHREVVESLADVSRMRLVVISDLFVPSSKASDEAHKCREVNVAAADQPMLRQHPWQNCRELIRISKLPQFEDIKVVAVDLLEFIFSFGCQVKHFGEHQLGQLCSEFRKDGL